MNDDFRITNGRSCVPSQTLFVGLGSSHGDDQVGWLIADALGSLVPSETADDPHSITFRKARHPAQVLDWLEGVGLLVICDAVSGAGLPGGICSWRWPDSNVQRLRAGGSHDLGVSAMLELAAGLNRLPREVVICGIEAANTSPASGLSPAVRAALPELIRRIEGDLGRTPRVNAPDGIGSGIAHA